MGDAEHLAKRGVCRLERIHAVHPQIRQGKKSVRRATIAVLKNTGSGEIEYVLRDVARIAPIQTVFVSFKFSFKLALLKVFRRAI